MSSRPKNQASKSNVENKEQHQHQAEVYSIMTAEAPGLAKGENQKSSPVENKVLSSPALIDSQSASAQLNDRVTVSSSSTLASSPLQSRISGDSYLSYPPYSGTANHTLAASAPHGLPFGAVHVWGPTPLYMIPHPPPVARAAQQQVGGIASTALGTGTSFFTTNGDRPAPPPVLLLGGGGGIGASIDLHTNLLLQRQQQQFLLQQQLSLHAPLGRFSGPPSHSIAAMVQTNQPNLAGQDGTTSTSIIRGTDGPGSSGPTSTTIGDIKTSSLPNYGYRVQDKKDDSFESPNAHEASPGSTDEEILERPKRPLSAYNLFFKHERHRMVEEAAQREAAVNGKKRRRARRVRHGISFETMAKEIGQKWKQVDKESLEHFETLARVEKQKYEVAMEKYKNQEKIAKENKRKRLESTLDVQTLNAYLVKEQHKQEVGGKRGKRQRNNKDEEGLP